MKLQGLRRFWKTTESSVLHRFVHVAGRALSLGFAFAFASCGQNAGQSPGEGLSKEVAKAEYTTSAACKECHPEAYARWTGSLHDRAMEVVNSQSVAGDFSGVRFENEHGAARFERDGARWLIHSETAEGRTEEFEVRYTFGVEPLQQYLIEQPEGRLQAFHLAWDSRPRASGGQRWFSLQGPGGVQPDDVMHWTGPGQNWNSQCSDCHSTGIKRGYNADTGNYATTWAEIDVGCEACHGPGSEHVAWASAASGRGASPGEDLGLRVDLRSNGATWERAPGARIAKRSSELTHSTEVETCAPCHSRRSRLREDTAGVGFLDAYRPELLETGLYHPDGQILDEVYVWGSFVQSRMYRAGVRCSDCHDPHSLELKRRPEQVCVGCHASEAYATPEHHHHSVGSAGSFCVDCHMPARTYMQIDARRDHGFRVPRPEMSRALGTPDACTGCHADRTGEWAGEVVAGWSGTETLPRTHFGETLAAARRGDPAVAPALARLAADPDEAGIVRATALAQFVSVPASSELLRDTIAQTRTDPDPLVRYGAARASEALVLPDRVSAVGPLTDDPVTLVRAEAGRVLAGVPADVLAEDARAHLDRALETYRATQRVNPDRPSAHVNLGLLALRRGDLAGSEAAYRQALRVGPYFVPAYVNLADLLRATGRDPEGRALLERALEIAPEIAEVHHALGLLEVRAQKREAAMPLLARAAELAPGNPRLVYVYAVALHSGGQTETAIDVLVGGLERSPHSLELLEALVEFSRSMGRDAEADGYLRRLHELGAGAIRP